MRKRQLIRRHRLHSRKIFRFWSKRTHPLCFVLSIALLFAAFTVRYLEQKLRPVVSDAAQLLVEHHVTVELERQIAQLMSEERSLVSVQRDDTGQILAFSMDTAALNRLRSELITQTLQILDDLDCIEVPIPLGSLLDSDLAWAIGPAIRVRSLVYGTVSAQFESELSSAGINQTLYRIWLDLELPIRLYLPGGPEESCVQTRLSVSETVIVGKIPEFISPYSQSPLNS